MPIHHKVKRFLEERKERKQFQEREKEHAKQYEEKEYRKGYSRRLRHEAKYKARERAKPFRKRESTKKVIKGIRTVTGKMASGTGNVLRKLGERSRQQSYPQLHTQPREPDFIGLRQPDMFSRMRMKRREPIIKPMNPFGSPQKRKGRKSSLEKMLWG